MKNKLLPIILLFSWLSTNAQEDKIVIKTVFHFVHNEITENNIPDISINYVLNKINQGFNNVDKDKIASEYKDRVASCNIFFELAETDYYGNSIDPISWHHTNKKSFLPYLNDKNLKQNGYLDSSRYLNIWVCNIAGDVAGGYNSSKLFLKIASEQDGIVIDISEFINESSYYLVSHEIGHWFGLDHIWGKTGVSSGIHNCLDDDGISDTPKQKSPNVRTTNPEVSCDGYINSNHQNFMDYSYDTGMFTQEQASVMRKYIRSKRAGLLWKSNNTDINKSILSKKAQRTKPGTRMIVNHLYPYSTITDRDMVELFNSIGIIPTKEKLKQLGLIIVANNKFEDLATGEFVDQHQIYERLDIEKAKRLANKVISKNEVNPTNLNVDLSIGIENRRHEKVKVVMKNKQTNQEYIYDVDKIYRTYLTANSVRVLWVKLPAGNYSSNVYTQSDNKLISSNDLILNKNNQLVTIKAE